MTKGVTLHESEKTLLSAGHSFSLCCPPFVHHNRAGGDMCEDKACVEDKSVAHAHSARTWL